MIKMCIKVCIKIQCRKKKKFFALLEQNLFYLFHIFTHILVYGMKKKKLQKKKIFYLFKSIRRQIFVFKQLEILD